MANLPRATTRLDPVSGAPGAGDKLVCVLSPVNDSADFVPRLFGSAQAVYDQHGYCEGVEYAAMHMSQTGLPVLFVGLPISTLGAVSRSTSFGNTGSSVVTVAAGADGLLAEHDGVLRCVTGGTIGTDQIKLELSLDGGRTFIPVRLGTASSYALPYVNATVSFAAGTLVAGDTILEWHGSAPLAASADLPDARSALASGMKFFRSMLLCGDIADSTYASAYVSELNAYASSNDRFVFGRGSIPDRLPQASLSQSYARMTGSPSLTFAEVGGTGDTVTRNTGSWIDDGFVVGDTIVFTNTVSNNISGPIASLSATVITFGTTDVAAEVVAGATATGGPTLTFAEVGGTGDTVTRNRGSWLADGFRVGDTITFDGTASNDVSGAIASLSATVITFGTTDLAAEVILASSVTAVSGQTKAAWMAAKDAAFASVDGAPRLDLSAGRAAVFSPFSGWARRIPAAWLASVREYQHDLHIPTWRKDFGPVATGDALEDGANVLVEWDDRFDGGAGSAARFTTLRTWSNGPGGAFVALSLTRAGDGKVTMHTSNMAVINAGSTVVQLATENVVGRTLQLNADGTATSESLNVIATEVNAQVEQELLSDHGEGPRCSSCKWTPNADDLYNVAEPTMHGVLDIELNGIVFSVDTAVRVNSPGSQA